METFYGKTCNYAFPTSAEGFKVYATDGSKKQEQFTDVDSCILWAVLHVFVDMDVCIGPFSPVAIKENKSSDIVLKFGYADQLLEYAWETLEDVNINEDEETEQDWFIFPEGTYREEIWHWFDERHTGGVGQLIHLGIVPYPNVKAGEPLFPDTKEYGEAVKNRLKAAEQAFKNAGTQPDTDAAPQVFNGITRGMIEEGYKAGLIKLDGCPDSDGPVCWIGGCWFYFDEEGSDVEKYKAETPEQTVIDRIYGSLNAFLGDWKTFGDEYTYYACYLVEHGIKPDAGA